MSIVHVNFHVSLPRPLRNLIEVGTLVLSYSRTLVLVATALMVELEIRFHLLIRNEVRGPLFPRMQIYRTRIPYSK